MWALTLILMLAAAGAGLLAWQHATSLDQQQREGWSHPPGERRAAWPLLLGSIVAAVAATTTFQVAVLSSLGR